MRAFGAGFGTGTAWASADGIISDAAIVAASAIIGTFATETARVGRRGWQNG